MINSFLEDFNNFVIKVENSEESVSLDIILKAPEGNRLSQMDRPNDTNCSMIIEVFQKRQLHVMPNSKEIMCMETPIFNVETFLSMVLYSTQPL